MQIDIVRGSDADTLLRDEGFRAAWSRLWDVCPWATAFQRLSFATAWYPDYRSRFEPLLLIARDERGEPAGIFPLARSLEGNELVNVGAHQAEYHAWICAPELGDAFPARAIEAIRGDIPSSGLQFRYLPPGAPTAWLTGAGLGRLCVHRPVPRPLMEFGDGKEVEASLRKSGNKSKLRQLQKRGEVEFKRITDPAELAQIFDPIIHCYDTRRLAINHVAPFQIDPLKKQFHLSMAAAPDLLHVTVLKVGGQVVSAQINSCSKTDVQVSLIMHNPLYSKASPGKLHLLFLAKMLRDEGYDRLDLTPGGDAYKERFATRWDEVRLLSVFPTEFARRRAALRARIEDSGRQVLKRAGVSTAQAKLLVTKLKSVRPADLAGLLARRSKDAGGMKRIYTREVTAPATGADGPELIRRNALEDLLAYQPAESFVTRPEFLSAALERIEEGYHLYTYVEGGRMLHYAWLLDRPSPETLQQVLPGVELPADSSLVLDLYTVPQARGRGLASASLRTMLRDAGRVAGVGKVAIAVPARYDPARRVVEKLGFTCNGK